jgi:hypothetical protein
VSGNIKWLGTLYSYQPDEKVWSGSISAKKSSEDDFEKYTALLPTVYKPIGPKAAIRCIDGRPADKSPSRLGPQVAGGSPGLALAWLVSGSTQQDIIAAYAKFLKQNFLGYAPGAHTDDLASEPNCGCGAIDKMAEKIQKIKPFVQTIMGEDFEEAAYTKVISLFNDINPDDSLPASYQRQLIELTSKNKGSVEKVTGQHKELAAIINKVPGTTLDKDAFSKRTNNNAQSFGFDYWFAKQASSGNVEYLTAIVTYQVAAAMVLTDGSLSIGVRQ